MILSVLATYIQRCILGPEVAEQPCAFDMVGQGLVLQSFASLVEYLKTIKNM